MKFRTRFFKCISAILVVSLFLVSSINVFVAENTDIVEDNIKITNKEYYDVGDIKFDIEYTQDGKNCYDSRELCHIRTESKEQPGYTQTFEVYGLCRL